MDFITEAKSIGWQVGSYLVVAKLFGNQRIANKIPLISSLFERLCPKPYRTYSIREIVITSVICGYILPRVYEFVAAKISQFIYKEFINPPDEKLRVNYDKFKKMYLDFWSLVQSKLDANQSFPTGWIFHGEWYSQLCSLYLSEKDNKRKKNLENTVLAVNNLLSSTNISRADINSLWETVSYKMAHIEYMMKTDVFIEENSKYLFARKFAHRSAPYIAVALDILVPFLWKQPFQEMMPMARDMVVERSIARLIPSLFSKR